MRLKTVSLTTGTSVFSCLFLISKCSRPCGGHHMTEPAAGRLWLSKFNQYVPHNVSPLYNLHDKKQLFYIRSKDSFLSVHSHLNWSGRSPRLCSCWERCVWRPAAGRSPVLDSRVATHLNPARLRGTQPKGHEHKRHARQWGLRILTELFQNLSRSVHLSPGREGWKLGQNTLILLFSFNQYSALVFPDCSHNSGGLWMKWSTDYDSLDAGLFFLWEQMLLQPFEVIVGAVNVVLPRSSQLQIQQTRQHGCLVTPLVI